MPRYKLTIEYKGADYAGWQRQPHALSIQQAVETAIQKFCGEAIAIRGAGRTDAGVHAWGQVAHVDLNKLYDPITIQNALNFHLKPQPIAIVDVIEVPVDFDARFSATARHYLYRIQNRKAPPTFKQGQVWWIPQTLDINAMHQAAQRLVGTHDFTTFRASECQAKSPIKTINRIHVKAGEDHEIHIHVSARSFLHRQVRSFVGCLKLVGIRHWTDQDLRTALATKNRAACGPVAPAHGLYLVGVDYD